MASLEDYVYRYANRHLPLSGRCRVRIYAREGTERTVLLTELDDNPGESIANVCDQLATALTARWKLDPRKTRWLHQDATLESISTGFEEVEFTWVDKQTATAPRWREISDELAMTLTGDSAAALVRRIGDSGIQREGK
jgi:hypothetical protein